ncbi:MAG: hypothetical protein K5655_09220 [Lachnospiraceae bacterium]|nr:hypothetical protein [Lachnospiraceae bacterium]
MAAGVYPSTKKDGTKYYRASLTHKGKHISLGGFPSEDRAERAYRDACAVLRTSENSEPPGILDHNNETHVLPFDKWVALVNFRDNGIWCRGPIYLRKGYFEYYLDTHEIIRFGADDLFYYTHHTIQKRGGHLFVSDFGMQVSILSRYGIRPYAVSGRDYVFKNGDPLDFRPGNLTVINRYNGVRTEKKGTKESFAARINLPSGSTVVIGHYDTENEAAIAYNKAVSILREQGFSRNWEINYLEDVSPAEYRIIYAGVKIRKALLGIKP